MICKPYKANVHLPNVHLPVMDVHLLPHVHLLCSNDRKMVKNTEKNQYNTVILYKGSRLTLNTQTTPTKNQNKKTKTLKHTYTELRWLSGQKKAFFVFLGGG